MGERVVGETPTGPTKRGKESHTMTKRPRLQEAFSGNAENPNGRKPRKPPVQSPAPKAPPPEFDRFRQAYPEGGWRDNRATYEAWQRIVAARPEMAEQLVIAAATRRLKTGGTPAQYIQGAHNYLTSGGYDVDLGGALGGATERTVWLMREMQTVWRERPNSGSESLFFALYQHENWGWHDGGFIPDNERVVLEEAYRSAGTLGSHPRASRLRADRQAASFLHGVERPEFRRGGDRESGPENTGKSQPCPAGDLMTSLFELLADQGILAQGLRAGSDHRLICSKCQGGRTKEKSLALTLDADGGAVWVCHRASCGWTGNVPGRHAIGSFRRKAYVRPEADLEQPAEDWMLAYFRERGISEETVHELGIYSSEAFFPETESRLPAIVFPFVHKGVLLRRKYRGFVLDPDTSKPFSARILKKVQVQDKDSEPCLFNGDSIASDEVIIVEGEADVAALWECGYRSVVTLPDGAMNEPHDQTKGQYSQKLAALARHDVALRAIDRIILAGDMDRPGIVLMDELERYLQPERCLRVAWPQGCKDAAETLQKLGPEPVRRAILQAIPGPASGLVRVPGVAAVEVRYQRDLAKGLTLGIEKLDEVFKLPPGGGLTVLTGIPGRGKTSFVTWVAVESARRYAWKWALYSAELPTETASAYLARTYARRALEYDDVAPLRGADLDEALQWVREHFIFISPLLICAIGKAAMAIM